ncbi:MAG TPA: diguanylate cyclase [Pyrinomonadaceae bacterium]|nr:diguanylate cyclase [Pyrinomonadaceae bacterium]
MFLENIKIKKLGFPDYNLQSAVFWCSTLLLSVSLFAAAVYDSSSFSAAQFTVIFATLIFSVLSGRYQTTIPKTRIKIKSQDFIIFWSVIWLGVSATVLVAAASLLINCFVRSKDKKRGLFTVSVGVISTFAAGSVFYSALKLAGFTESVAANNQLDFIRLAIAAVVSASTHYILTAAFNSLLLWLENICWSARIYKENFFRSAGSCLFSLVAAFIFHFAFLQFGLYFGLVLLPLAFVAHLAYRIHIARLAQKTKEISEASRVHLATVEALATAIDARDQVGIGHVRRTQIYAVGVGKILDLSESELQALNTGALLHDIGKLAVPDHILNKPGRLTPAELEKTKIHASVGASILEKVNFSYPVVPTVKYHHEMWDGRGYPEGLSKETIPLTARILSIADAYDTLRGARPYRPAVSRDGARKFLLNGAGTQFDPKLVDLFLRNLRQFEDEITAQGFSYNLDAESSLQNSFDNDQNYVEQIKRANREVFTLYELARVFSSSLNLEDTLSLFVKKIGEFVPFDSCVVYLLEVNGEFAKAAHASGINGAALSEKRVKAGEGATGFVLKKRQPVNDIDPGMDFTYDQTEFVQEYVGMTSLPLIAEEKLVGAVSLYSCEIETYEEEHLRLLEAISRIASDAIATALQHAETESKALTDPMTGLPNARSLQMQFEKEVARASRKETGFHLLMLDLDGFKAVNDNFGHKAGDKLLKEISKVMRGQLRDYDFLARYAGDEFVAIVPETGIEDIRELSRRIEKAVYDFALSIDDKGNFARVGVSLGAASYPRQGDTLDQIIVAADKAMYAIKALRKERKKPLSETPPSAELPTRDHFIVELDESHIISSQAIN